MCVQQLKNNSTHAHSFIHTQQMPANKPTRPNPPPKKNQQTEDTGAGPVRRVPFEAYEAITYQEGMEVRACACLVLLWW